MSEESESNEFEVTVLAARTVYVEESDLQSVCEAAERQATPPSPSPWVVTDSEVTAMKRDGEWFVIEGDDDE